MRSGLYAQLVAIARRESRDASVAEDLVQEAMLAAVLVGRTDFQSPETARWLAGTVRNQARMAARAAIRRQHRDAEWRAQTEQKDQTGGVDFRTFLTELPPALRTIAALILSGHNRREVAHLLRLSDTALRQRISALKRRTIAAELISPLGMPGLNLDLAYGRIRDALLPMLLRHGGILASHDPDGHLFVVRGSQIATPRQLGVQTNSDGAP